MTVCLFLLQDDCGRVCLPREKRGIAYLNLFIVYRMNLCKRENVCFLAWLLLDIEPYIYVFGCGQCWGKAFSSTHFLMGE